MDMAELLETTGKSLVLLSKKMLMQRAAGPRDAEYLFDQFVDLMAGAA